MSVSGKLRIGSRGSDLALAQAHYVDGRLRSLDGAPETEIIIIKTSGDQIQDIPLSEVDTGNSPDERKGFFTKEIEDALLAKSIDIAVHSFKDMPTQSVDGLSIESMPQRLNPLDVLVFHKSKRVSDAPPFVVANARIGSSSVRRVSNLRLLWPELKNVPLRGNVPTRIKKLFTDEVDAILLSGAGVERLKGLGFFDQFDVPVDELEFHSLAPELFPPAPAQGALAIQCRSDDAKTIELIRRIQDNHALRTVVAERHLLAGLRGGCHLPLGAHCVQNGDLHTLHLFLGSEAEDNRKKRSFLLKRSLNDPARLANEVLNELLHPGTVVVTGRDERNRELLNRFPDLISLPLIRIEYDYDQEASSTYAGWRESTNGNRALVAVFSESGVHAFKRFTENEKISLPEIAWAVTGERTKAAVETLFPGQSVELVSPDGTGEALARELVDRKLPGPVLTVSAESHREEFYGVMKSAGREVSQIKLYRTERRAPEIGEIEAIPVGAKIVFASPSAVDTFFDVYDGYLKQTDAGRGEHLFCALGPTTHGAIQNRGYEAYATARTPDLDRFVDELL